MANKPIEKIPLSKDKIEAIRKNFSLRALAKQIDIGDRTLRYWLEKQEMPIYLWRKIFPLVKKYLSVKYIWVRIGVTVPVTDDELYELLEQHMIDGQLTDVNLSEEEARECFVSGFVDGDAYIPSCILDDYNDWYQEEKERREKDARRSADRS